jgi:hypothetical protein
MCNVTLFTAAEIFHEAMYALSKNNHKEYHRLIAIYKLMTKK